MVSEQPTSDFIRQTADGVNLYIHLQPRASRCEICGTQGDALKVRLTSPPVDDAANRQLTEFVAKTLGIARSKVTIISGARSRHKTLLISEIDVTVARRKLLNEPP